MRILVTGASGYIGSALVEALPRDSVVATDQSAPAKLGFPHNQDIQEIVREYEEAAVANYG